jgi:hypothetical protein
VAKVGDSVIVMLCNKSVFDVGGFRKPAIMGVEKNLCKIKKAGVLSIIVEKSMLTRRWRDWFAEIWLNWQLLFASI